MGERGLKHRPTLFHKVGVQVAPYGGAWIETIDRLKDAVNDMSLPMGERGLKQGIGIRYRSGIWSLPMGERGLKLMAPGLVIGLRSRSLWGSVD